MASAGSGYKQSLGADGPPGSYDDIDHADVFLVIGSNMADCHPILFLRLLDRVAAGAKLIVVDPRRTATAEQADLFLQIRPGTDLALLNGLLHLVAADGGLDEAFIAAHTEGWDRCRRCSPTTRPTSSRRSPARRRPTCAEAAALIGGAANFVSCWTMGLNQSTHGTWNTNAICNLHLATGTIGRTGSGPLSLTGQPNAMGGREMGYMGPGLPGQRSALVDDDRRFVEDVWGLAPGTLRAEGGTGTIDLFARMAAGEVKACWIMCTNPIASVGNRSTVIAGLEAAELVITQDAFVETETNAYADIVLPAAMWAEGDGVMVNSERNVTLVPRAVDPPGDARPDWQLIADVACAMGFAADFTYASAEEVFDEIAPLRQPGDRLRPRGVTLRPAARGPGAVAGGAAGAGRNPHPLPSTPPAGCAFPTPSGRAVFHARPHVEPAELPDDDHPFTFNTGRLPHQWHTMTKTGKVARLNRLDDGPFVEVHPADAAPLGITAGDLVEVASRRGRAVLPAVVTDRVQPGNLFAPIHWNDLHGEYACVNAVTNDAVDPISFQPELKVCAVSLTKVAVPAAAHRPAAAALAGGARRRRAGARRRTSAATSAASRRPRCSPAAGACPSCPDGRRSRPPSQRGSTACSPGAFAAPAVAGAPAAGARTRHRPVGVADRQRRAAGDLGRRPPRRRPASPPGCSR